MGSPDSLKPFISSLIECVGASKHLARERGLTQLQDAINNSAYTSDDSFWPQLIDGVKGLLASDVWENKLGGLLATKAIVEHRQDSTFDNFALSECDRLLEDGEVRVRQAVGDLLKALAKKLGTVVFEQMCDRVLTSIHEHYDREGEGEKEKDSTGDAPEIGDLISALLHSTYKPRRPGEGDLRHGTEGWKCLETSMKAFQQIVEGCGPSIHPFLTQPLLQLLLRSIYHPNRFVRETTHFTVSSVCAALEGSELIAMGSELSPRLADGLSDNWSQVRYAASTAVRSFFLHLPEESRSQFYDDLLPPMCLNRYYVAEGVRLYSQETWKQVVAEQGRSLVAKHIGKVVDYYNMQSKASNHAVREAACACLAELMEKVDRTAVAPHVPELVRALLLCFRDMSWPVRDAACTASGRCVLAYPDECKGVIEELFKLWVDHLSDNIPTVRENSAVALANYVRAYGPEASKRVIAVAAELLPMARQQPAESTKYSELENSTKFGVAHRKARDNDPEVHSDQDMFSCGSLVARFSTSYLVKSDGCMDYGFARGKEPWEASDGAMYLVKELASVAPESVPALMPMVVELVNMRSFQHAFNMHETVWRCVPGLAKALGKQKWKSLLGELIEPMIEDLRCGHQLAEVAASKCVEAMRELLGPKIFDGRLTDEQLSIVQSQQPVAFPPSAVLPFPRA